MMISGEIITYQCIHWSLLPDACHSNSVLMVCSHHFLLPPNCVTDGRNQSYFRSRLIKREYCFSWFEVWRKTFSQLWNTHGCNRKCLLHFLWHKALAAVFQEKGSKHISFLTHALYILWLRRKSVLIDDIISVSWVW